MPQARHNNARFGIFRHRFIGTLALITVERQGVRVANEPESATAAIGRSAPNAPPAMVRPNSKAAVKRAVM